MFPALRKGSLEGTPWPPEMMQSVSPCWGLFRPQVSCCRVLQVLSSAGEWVNPPTHKNPARRKFTPFSAKRGQQLLPFALPITVTATRCAGPCVQDRSPASPDASSCSTRISIKRSRAHKGCCACQLQRNLLLMSDFKALMSLQSSPLRLQSWTSRAWH